MTVKSLLKVMLCSVIVASLSTVTSCTNSNETHISTNDVKKAVEQLDILKKDAVAVLAVGYYEENDAESRYKLRQLAANNMITYKAEQINEEKYSYWRGKYVEEHVFVTVELTDKGRKLISQESAVSDEEFVVDYTQYPEYEVVVEESIPVLNGTKDEVAEEECAIGDEAIDAFESTVPATQPVAEKDLLKEALAKVNKEVVQVTAYRIKVAEVYNLKCTEEMWNRGVATCKVKVEVTKSTPFGRVLLGAYDGMPEVNDTELNYYIDKGWVVND